MERCVLIPWKDIPIEYTENGSILKVTGRQAEYLCYVHEKVRHYFKTIKSIASPEEIANYIRIPAEDVYFCLELMDNWGEAENLRRKNAHNN